MSAAYQLIGHISLLGLVQRKNKKNSGVDSKEEEKCYRKTQRWRLISWREIKLSRAVDRSTSGASSIEHHLGNRLIAQTVLSSTTFELQAVRMTLQVKGESQVHRIEG